MQNAMRCYKLALRRASKVNLKIKVVSGMLERGVEARRVCVYR